MPRVDDRKVLNGIFWRLRTGAPWADIPERYGPYTTCYNRYAHSDDCSHRFRLKPASDSDRSQPGVPMIPAG